MMTTILKPMRGTACVLRLVCHGNGAEDGARTSHERPYCANEVDDSSFYADVLHPACPSVHAVLVKRLLESSIHIRWLD